MTSYSMNNNENMNPGDGKKRMDGKIVCDVKNCVYHDGDFSCTAEKVAIGPTYASDCTDTVCATFKQKALC